MRSLENMNGKLLETKRHEFEEPMALLPVVRGYPDVTAFAIQNFAVGSSRKTPFL
jgi:hypothetical protein